MKNNLDKVFKESLEGHEFPYDAKAWDSLSKALDKKVPAGNQGSNMKWYLGGAAVVGAVIISALYINSTSTSITDSKTQRDEVITSENTKGTNSSTQDINETSSLKTNEHSTTAQSGSTATTHSPASQQVTYGNGVKAGDNTPSTGTGAYNPNTTPNRQDPTIHTSIEIPAALVISIPEIGSKCQGESFTLENKNEVSLILISPTGDETILRAKSKNSVALYENGDYNIVYKKNNQIAKLSSFNVLPAPSVDLSYDPINIYDKGLPSIQMKSSSIGTSFEWTIPGTKNPVYGKEVNAHFFNKGTYKVNLTVTSSNGCSATETMNVNMPEDYNLMAVNAINPNSHIEKNRTFMPYALKERNTPFTLLIIDPATGSIIFESNDVNNPWTGIDRRNGQAVEVNKPYVWKVSLQKPMEGEKAEYKGTVILQ